MNDEVDLLNIPAAVAIAIARKQILRWSRPKFARLFNMTESAIRKYEQGTRKDIETEVLVFSFNVILNFQKRKKKCPTCGVGWVDEFIPTIKPRAIVDLRNRALWNDIEDYLERKNNVFNSYEAIARHHGVTKQRVEQVVKSIKKLS